MFFNGVLAQLGKEFLTTESAEFTELDFLEERNNLLPLNSVFRVLRGYPYLRNSSAPRVKHPETSSRILHTYLINKKFK